MRSPQAAVLAAALAAALALPARAQEAFDACEVLTPADAQAALGVPVTAEPVNPKAKRPRVVATCTYRAAKDGTPLAVSAQFRFGKSEADIDNAFDAHRLDVQTKPLLIDGAPAFWSARTGQLNLRKGRTWVQITAGPEKVPDRQADAARRLAEILVKKL